MSSPKVPSIQKGLEIYFEIESRIGKIWNLKIKDCKEPDSSSLKMRFLDLPTRLC